MALAEVELLAKLKRVKLRATYFFFLLCFMLADNTLVKAEGSDTERLNVPLEVVGSAGDLNGAGSEWQLCASSDVYAFTFFNVGEVSLWLRNCDVDIASVYRDEKKLEFLYARNIPGYAFQKSAAHYLKKNLSEERFKNFEQSVQEMGDAYQDVEKGDQYTMLFTPLGLTLFRNGVELKEIKEPSFAQDYFLIWFGDHPFNNKLKSRLLEPFQNK